MVAGYCNSSIQRHLTKIMATTISCFFNQTMVAGCSNSSIQSHLTKTAYCSILFLIKLWFAGCRSRWPHQHHHASRSGWFDNATMDLLHSVLAEFVWDLQFFLDESVDRFDATLIMSFWSLPRASDFVIWFCVEVMIL